MAAKDGSFSFDFKGTYRRIEPNTLIDSVLDDGRTLLVTFDEPGSCGTTTVTEIFEAETVNSLELQKN